MSTRKIAYNIIFNSFMKVTTTVMLSLISIRLITGYLGKEGFGDYATVLAFFSFFSAIADLGIGSITAREISREGVDEGGILGRVASLRIVSSTLLFLIVPLFLPLFSYPFPVKVGILVAAAAVIFSTFSIFLNGIFQKNIAMDRIAMIEFMGKMVQVAAVYLVVTLNLGFLAIASTLILSISFNAMMAYLLSRKYAKFKFVLDVPFWKRFLGDSLPLGGSALITFFYFKMDTILLSFIKGSAAVGTYSVAYKVMENLTFFPALLAGLILPLLSRALSVDRNKFQIIADTTFRVFSIIAIPIVLSGVFFSDRIISIVSGNGFQDAVPVLEILLVSLIFIFFGNYFNMLLIVGNHQKALMKVLLAVAIVNIIANLILIPRFSFVGAAATSLGTELLVSVSTGLLTFRLLKYSPSFEKIGRIVVSASIMAAVLFLTRTLPFVLSGTLSGLVYLASLWTLKAVSSVEITGLFSKQSEQEAAFVEEIL
ncbi:MAG: flippase [Candidatus Moranbacteria bacterium]|nr:flippase [Candidatus Moranbacteria bacterium]